MEVKNGIENWSFQVYTLDIRKMEHLIKKVIEIWSSNIQEIFKFDFFLISRNPLTIILDLIDLFKVVYFIYFSIISGTKHSLKKINKKNDYIIQSSFHIYINSKKIHRCKIYIYRSGGEGFKSKLTKDNGEEEANQRKF